MNRRTQKPNSSPDIPAHQQASPVELKLWVDYEAAASKMPVRHINEVVAQVHKDDVFISFFLMAPPVFLGSPGERKKYAETSSIQPECVARISMSPQLLKDTVRILQEQIAIYEASMEDTGSNDATTD
jgi:hypothetical protein